MNQQVMDALYAYALDSLVGALAEQMRADQERTMMEQVFAKLERMDRPTMMDTLLGSFAQMDASKRHGALDEMVKVAPRKVRDALCNVGFRLRFGMIDQPTWAGSRLAADRIVQQSKARSR
ncbi:hypothetical protein [Burkholderia anthina]|uniref:hypothetical protein n=1 Tax=Burkholderia anthina TaxID=179879 RepID=UPI00158CCB87|nr:hypothetical protein [Burkholderia anthina]